MPIDQIIDLLTSGPIKFVLVALVVLIVIRLVWKFFRRRKRTSEARTPELILEVESLSEKAIPPGASMLEFYNVPMQLVAIVLAPAGRSSELPALNQLDATYDSISPGLSEVVRTHQPVLRRWPPQLSPRGFAHAFFTNVQLPGDAGKDTQWCSVAGMFKFDGRSAMAGLVMRATTNNSLSQTIIEHEGKWLDVLRVKRL